MAKKIAALERTSTLDLLSLPPSVHPIACKWVYKVKTRSNGSLVCLLVHTERNSPCKSKENAMFVVEVRRTSPNIICVAEKEELHFEKT